MSTKYQIIDNDVRRFDREFVQPPVNTYVDVMGQLEALKREHERILWENEVLKEENKRLKTESSKNSPFRKEQEVW